jgi:Tol biopolymer transport system component
MNRTEWLTEELIQKAFEQRADRATPGDPREGILSLTAATSQRAAWRLRLGTSWSTPILRPAWIALLVLAGLLGVALALALAGQHPQRARPGLLAYSQDGDVYLANADGSSRIRAVHDDGVVFGDPIWSSDSRWLAIHGSGSEFLLDPTTLGLRRVASGHDAVWASDGRSLAFVGLSASGEDVIEMVEVETGAVRDLEPKLDAGTSLGVPLAWSPDGRWFLAPTNASNGRRFVRIDAMTGDIVDIAPMPHLADPGAHWSPDSRRFAYARPDSCDNPPCASTIVVEDADLSVVVALTDRAKLSREPIWSPDGAWIAFTSGGSLDSSLSIVRPDGRDLRSLVKTTAQTLSWNADGTAVDLSTHDASTGSALGIFEVRVSDGLQRQLALPQGVDGYDWQAIPPGRLVPTLPAPPLPLRSPAASIPPLPSPPPAPPADPSGSWSGIAVDGYCSIVEFDTMTPRGRKKACSDVRGGPLEPDGAVFAPLGSGYAKPEGNGSVTIVRSDGSVFEALAAPGTVAADQYVEVDLAWSPDGRWLSVHRCVQGSNADCVHSEYLVLSRDGRNQHQVPGLPSWSPDGRRLVVKAQDGDLLLGSPDGSDLNSIGSFPMPSSWSPDASQFAFVRDGDAWIVNADGTDQRNVTQFAHRGAYDAAWSPDGRFIAVIQESQLWIARLASDDVLPIDLGLGRTSFYSVVPGTTDDVAWSPDSTRLAVVVSKREAPTTMVVRTRDWMAIALGGGDIESVAWSPDGRYIALNGFSSGEIDIANGDGSGRHMVWTPPPGSGSGRMTWVP